MKKYLFSLVVILTVSVSAFSQPDTLWTRTYGGNLNDLSYSGQQTSDGGFIITGWTQSYGGGNSDVYLIKIDANGNQQWDQTYGGLWYDGGYSVQQTNDGGFIIAGWTQSFGGGGDEVYLIKTDSSGTQQWYQTFGGIANDEGWSVQQTIDGGYIIAGNTNSYGASIYLIKTDAAGNQQWFRTFGGGWKRGYSVQQTTDGGYILVGHTAPSSVSYRDVYLIKTDTSGIEMWNQTFGGDYSDEGFCVQQTNDGGYIIAGYTRLDYWDANDI